MPVPGAVARLMVGEIAKYAVTGVRMVPGRAAQVGYTFRYPGLDGAPADTLTRNSCCLALLERAV